MADDKDKSSLPLLDTGDAGDAKVNIELESKNEGAADEPKNEGESDWFDAQADVEGQSRGRRLIRRLFPGKPKKVKPAKVKKEKPVSEQKPRTTPLQAAQTMTTGLNVLNRDEKEINGSVNLQFEDIIAETDVAQGFEFIWRLSFLFFNAVRVWSYRLVATILAIPLALIWGVVFAVLNVLTVWGFTPLLRVFDILLHHVHRVWSGLARAALDPLFTSAGLLLANIRTHAHPQPTVNV